MFFRNKFSFRQYSILEAAIANDTQAEFIASFGGFHVMAIATVQKVSLTMQVFFPGRTCSGDFPSLLPRTRI